MAGDNLGRVVPSVLEDLVLRKGDERAPNVGELVGDAVWPCSHDVVRPGVFIRRSRGCLDTFQRRAPDVVVPWDG